MGSGTEVGIVELADGEAEWRLGEAVVGEACAAAGERADAVRFGCAGGDVLEVEGELNVGSAHG